MSTTHLPEENNNKSWLILIAIGLFTFMSTLDASIVNIALPTISKNLHIPINEATWSVTIYLIVVSALLIFFGRIGDLLGKIYIFRVGTLIFTTGSLIAGFNFGIGFLLFARIVQAIGAAMTMSNSFGITTTVFPPRLRARAMSMVGIFVSLGSVTGPGLGGFLLQYLPWSAIFWVNVPIGIFAMLMGEKLFPKFPRKSLEKGMLDTWGTLSFFLAITTFFLGIEIGQVTGFLTPIPTTLILCALILFVFFLKHEKSTPSPMIELKMFQNQLFSISLLSALLIFMTNFFSSIIMPFYLQNFLGYSVGFSGLLMMVFPLTMILVGPIGGILGDKANKEWITAIGIFLVVLAQLLYTTLSHSSSVFMIVCTLCLNAAGASLFQAPNNALVMQSVDKKFLGVAGSVNALARNLGMVLGISAATLTLFSAMSSKTGVKTTTYLDKQPEIFLYGMHIAFLVSFSLAILTFLIVTFRLFRHFSKK